MLSHQSTLDARMEFCVNAPAAEAGTSLTMAARSASRDVLIPALMLAALNPIGAVTPPLTDSTDILFCAGFLAGRPDFADVAFLVVDFFAVDFFARKAMRQPLLIR
jgi:hypothetical protein